MADSLTYQSHAKINLYLDVLERRPDGYHDIETVFQTVSLCDTLTVTAHDRLELDCDDPAAGPDEQNLVFCAAKLLQKETGCTRGALLELHKEIPVAAGLAGGSGDAAAALVALNALWDLQLPDEQLVSLALRLGSDVPYCLFGGTMGGRERGNTLLPLAPMPETWFVMLHPDIQVSTAGIYNHPRLRKSGASNGEWSTAFDVAVTAISTGDVVGALYNSMESVVFEMHPDLLVLKNRLEQSGCVGALMSGSGPTIFGVCPSKQDAEHASRQFPDMRRSIAYSVSTGVVALE